MATATTTRIHSSGDQIKYVFTFASGQIVNAATFASGIGDRVQDYYFQVTGNTTDSDPAVSVSNSSGTFTFGISTPVDATSDLVVYATGS